MKGNLDIEYCPTKQMWADTMAKPLQGSDFKYMSNKLMGRTWYFIYLVSSSNYNDRGMLDDWVVMYNSSAEFVPESKCL